MSDTLIFDLEYTRIDSAIHKRVDKIILEWIDVPFAKGQRCKGVGTDCVGFATGVLDDLYGYERFQWESLPYGLSIHNPLGSYKIASKIRKNYPSVRVRDKTIEPGDWVILAPPNGGPGHVVIVSGTKNILYTVELVGVVPIGMGYSRCYEYLAHYRATDKHLWST